MGRLIVSAQMTMDGVMDQMEGWFDPVSESETEGLEELRAADALVIGRETYEHFSSYWPSGSGEYAELVNPIPKFVASRTLSGPLEWNAQLLGPDLAAEVKALKAEYPGQLITYGCGELASNLARLGLIDEVRLRVHPIAWGDGVRPFHAGKLPLKLRLISAKTFASGIVSLTYEPQPE
ncbi:MAG: hypothetical protein QOF76_633 [Solirubrobacteraceae bacterium]|nr:hypothetical protein [Solirubrobacteraceae bacterium]